MALSPLHIRAIFRDGKFEPQQPCNLPNDSEVELTVRSSGPISPPIIDAAERARVLAEVIAAMKANPIPASAPRYSRDELHERR